VFRPSETNVVVLGHRLVSTNQPSRPLPLPHPLHHRLLSRQTSPPDQPAAQPNAAMNLSSSYPKGTAAIPFVPPTSPAAHNGSMTSSSSRNHSRDLTAASVYRPGPPTGSHSSKSSMSGQPPYGGYPVQSPCIPINDSGRNSPYIEFLEDDRVPTLDLMMLTVEPSIAFQ